MKTVDERLQSLEAIPESDYTIAFVCEVAELCNNSLRDRILEGMNYKSKTEVAALVLENRPVIEGWSDVSALEEKLGISGNVIRSWHSDPEKREKTGVVKVLGRLYFNPAHEQSLIEEYRPVREHWPDVSLLVDNLGAERYVFTGWYRDGRMRKKTGAVKVGEKIFFSPEWYAGIQKKVERNGKYIPIYTAAEMLDESQGKVGSWRRQLKIIQPAGKKKMKFCPESAVLRLKEKLEAAKGKLTAEEVSTEINARLEDVKKYVPSVKHPVTGRLLYDPSVVEKYQDSAIACGTPYSEIADCFDAEIISDAALKRKLDYLLSKRAIPSLKMTRGCSPYYVTPDGEQMIKNIYNHMRKIRDNKVELLSVSESAKRMGIRMKQLEVLISNCGVKYFMTSPMSLSCALSVVQENRKVSLRPRIPFVLWTPKSSFRYLASPVVETLRKCIQDVKSLAPTERVYDGYWYKRLAQAIIWQPQ